MKGWDLAVVPFCFLAILSASWLAHRPDKKYRLGDTKQ